MLVANLCALQLEVYKLDLLACQTASAGRLNHQLALLITPSLQPPPLHFYPRLNMVSKILVLHGYAQNASIFSKRVGGFICPLRQVLT